MTFADQNLFEVFDFELLRGDPATALEAPLSLVLTESLAQTFFGDADPVGETLLGFGDLTYTVTGVVEDAPQASHLRYGSFVSWSSVVPGNGALEFGWLAQWRPQTMFTYVRLRPGTDPVALEAKLPDFMRRHFAQRAEQYHLYLQPLEDIYLGSNRPSFYQRSMVQGNRAYVYVLSIVALLILLIACVNFMNLATGPAPGGGRWRSACGRPSARSADSSSGSSSGRPFSSCGVGMVLALALVETVRPAFNALVGQSTARLRLVADPPVLAALVALVA